MKVSEVEKLLKNANCEIRREGGNHTIWYSKQTNAEFPVPRHKSKEIPIGTLNSILKAAGIKR